MIDCIKMKIDSYFLRLSRKKYKGVKNSFLRRIGHKIINFLEKL